MAGAHLMDAAVSAALIAALLMGADLKWIVLAILALSIVANLSRALAEAVNSFVGGFRRGYERARN